MVCIKTGLSFLPHYRCVCTSCLLDICHPLATLHYTTCRATGRKPEGGKCATVWPICIDRKELTLIGLPVLYMFNKIRLSTIFISHRAQLIVNLIWRLWPWQTPLLMVTMTVIGLWKRAFRERNRAKISMVTSVLHGGTQRDPPSHPAVTTAARWKDVPRRQRWWVNKTTGIVTGDASDECWLSSIFYYLKKIIYTLSFYKGAE